MDYELFISAAVSAISVGLYVLALWIGDHRTISTLAAVSDFTVAMTVAAIGLGFALGMSVHLLLNPHSWLQAVGDLMRYV